MFSMKEICLTNQILFSFDKKNFIRRKSFRKIAKNWKEIEMNREEKEKRDLGKKIFDQTQRNLKKNLKINSI
jgi:hypothetical protein